MKFKIEMSGDKVKKGQVPFDILGRFLIEFQGLLNVVAEATSGKCSDRSWHSVYCWLRSCLRIIGISPRHITRIIDGYELILLCYQDGQDQDIYTIDSGPGSNGYHHHIKC